MTALSFISMYVLMYAMVNRFANVYSNLNQFYMAGLMTAPMVVIELGLMGLVYDNKNPNIVIIAVSVVALGAFFLGIRQQPAIGDNSFLTSMIPDHAGAILMCESARIQDEAIKNLCGEMISSKQKTIEQARQTLPMYKHAEHRPHGAANKHQQRENHPPHHLRRQEQPDLRHLQLLL